MGRAPLTKTLEWIGGVDGYLRLIDQRLLPGRLEYLDCRDVHALWEAIRTLAVRGAPAIGVSAGYGLVLALQSSGGIDGAKEGLDRLAQARDYLASSRPTAVNLFWALDRVVAAARTFAAAEPGCGIDALRKRVLVEAQAICDEDIEMCRRIGLNGMRFIADGAGVLTHCNAGALATAGQGTALSPMFEAHRAGRRFKVYADETRPLLQGARLTAWELRQAGIDVTLLCDNMAAWLMKQGRVHCVITGADRIAANGDTANKIGTYGLSVLARRHGVPFYVAAPSSTFDLSLTDGGRIPIEQRCPDEVAAFAGVRTAPDGVGVYNPAFDVTDAGDIAAIITERGVIEHPTAAKVAEHLGGGRT